LTDKLVADKFGQSLTFYKPCVENVESGFSIHTDKIKNDIKTTPFNVWTAANTTITDIMKDYVVLPFV